MCTPIVNATNCVTATNLVSSALICGTTSMCTPIIRAGTACITGLSTSGCAVCVGASGLLTAYTAGGGSIIVAGGGTCSTIRCGVGNTATQAYSAALAGFCNTATSALSTIVGGCCNQTPTCNAITCFAAGYLCANAGDRSCACGFICLNANDFSSSFVTGNEYQFCYCNFAGSSGTVSGCFNFTTTSTSGPGALKCFTFCNASIPSCVTFGLPVCLGVAGADCGGALSQLSFTGCGSFIVNGCCNIGGGPVSFIGTGSCNRTTSTATCSAIISGGCNTISGYGSVIGGGSCHTIVANTSFIGNGYCNRITSTRGNGIGSGSGNTITNSLYSFIGGGSANSVCASGGGILAGISNTVNNACSFIIGSSLTSSATLTTYTNALSKTSGTFRINHPDPSKTATKYLQHSFVESPTRGDNIYRFSVTTCNCAASLDLPDYYKFLNENDQVWISPKNHFGSAYGIVDSCQSCVGITSNCDGEYNVLVIGTRKDIDAKNGWLGVEVWK
jgi:hypothetical protein